MNFQQYIQDEISKEAPDHYDPNGNSSRAVMTRGFIREVLWQYRQSPSVISRYFKYFEGFNTPLSWFLTFPLLGLIPVLPISWGFFSIKKAKKDYYKEFLRKKYQST